MTLLIIATILIAHFKHHSYALFLTIFRGIYQNLTL